MKKIFLLFWFFALFGIAEAQTTYTTNRNLALPPAAPGTWGEQYNNNFTELDISKIPRVTNATKPASPEVNTVIVVTDAANGSTCSTGGGSFQNQCQWNGSAWVVIGGSGAVGSASVFDSTVAFTADISPAQITANQDDYAGCVLASNTVCRITTDASRNITGFAGGSDGKLLFLYNVGSFNAVLKNLTTSSAINQLTINADITLGPNQGIILQYDSTSTKWRAASGISGGAGQAADNDLTALAGFSGAGFPTRTATDTWAQRSLDSANTNNMVITNSLGIAGNPTWDVGPNVALTTRSFTATAGDFSLGAASSFTFPIATGATPTLSGRCAYDSTANRLKCGFNGSTVTLALTSEMQPLSSNLTALAGITGTNNAVPVFTGAGAMQSSTLPLCVDSAGQHLNYDTATRTFACGTSAASGLSGLTTSKYLIATGASSADTSGNLSQAAGVVNASGGFTVGDVATNYLTIDTSGVTGAKTWTPLNFSGTIRPSTGAITAGHVVTVDANGLLVDGGVAGSGTWTDSSTSTGTNKTIDVEGTGNVITTVSKVWLPAAGGTVAAPGLLWDTLAATPPTASCSLGSTETTMIRCVADFPDSDGDYALQQTLLLPDDWTGVIGIKFLWRTATANSGLNVVWQAAISCRADAEVDDAAFSTTTTITDAGKGTTNQLNTTAITTVNQTGSGCAAGELMHLKIWRQRTNASDTMTGVVSLAGVELTMRRAQ